MNEQNGITLTGGVDATPTNDGAEGSTGDPPTPLRGVDVDASPLRDALTVEDVQAWVLKNVTPDSPRPATGRTVRLTLDERDCERIRTGLRRFTTTCGRDGTMLAATALHVSLQELLAFLETTDRPVEIEFDAGDCMLMSLALLQLADEGHEESYRRRGIALCERIRADAPGAVEVLDCIGET